ncbi:FliI/YscN family ATPase [Sandaracinobacteroides sp. A072]|uniref:FliI/YscN family ATPase n=1 Tax=Sandaracinobacteroides sp. A072 TaxID=3461146 RepID=UPI004042E0D9
MSKSPALGRRAEALARLAAATAFRPEAGGRIRAFDGMLLRAEGLHAPVGALVRVDADGGELLAEVAGFRSGDLLLMALSRGAVAPGARAVLAGQADRVAVGPGLMGRVVDAMGAPADGLPPPRAESRWPLHGAPLPALDRAEVTAPLPTGVRAIDMLLTLGRGQRMGLIAGSGVGKSVLMQQLVAGAAADAVVVALIGERGREIAGFVGALADSARARTHVIAVPADHAAPLRLRGALSALAVSEWLRARGQHVLLLMDSLTRVAHAQREIGLATGEPPGPRGYPASALALIAQLVERAGNDARTGGAVTALFTVLADGDDVVGDPVVDAARGVLDGHVVLDREIAARGRFPAIDLGHSISRTMAACVSPAHMAAATTLRKDQARLDSSRDLIAMGAYAPGRDPALDAALAREISLEAFLAQKRDERAAWPDSLDRLLAGWGG